MKEELKKREAVFGTPHWFKDGKVDELAFLDEICREGPIYCVDGVFYTGEEEPIREEELLRRITDELSKAVLSGLSRRSRDLMNLMKIRWNYRPAEADEMLIHVDNGTVQVGARRFTTDKVFTTQRMPVPYYKDAPRPVKFLEFLEQLLYPEDIVTVQEYMGYCLVPTNRAQKMLIIMGQGGEGKSVLGQVLKMLIGKACVNGSLMKICTNPFARADLEHKLVMIDDDMATSALPQTHYLKTLVTLEGETDLEKKCLQSYQGRIYTRFLCLSNGALSSLYDLSDGFFRRQILLETKPRPADRVDDPYLADFLYAELPGILHWALAGLFRLRSNDYRFTVSQRANENLKRVAQEADTVKLFLESRGYITFDAGGCASSADLTATYKRFCQENDLLALSDSTFRARLSARAFELGLTATKHIPSQNRKDIRGYLGIKLDMPANW